MNVERKAAPLSKFPTNRAGRPEIFLRNGGNGETEYPAFCLKDIFDELFVKTKHHHPLIQLATPLGKFTQKDDFLKFLLPADMFEALQQENITSSDLREFPLASTRSNKITKLLFGLFSSPNANSEKLFVEKIQAHFADMLDGATYEPPLLKEICWDRLNEQTFWGFANTYIVPYKTSKIGNAALQRLVDSKEPRNLAKAIANIFISAMLGLYPIKYSGSESQPISKKTYLLNRRGMEYIWAPEEVTDTYIKIYDAKSFYDEGLYAQAYTKTVQWLYKYKPSSNLKKDELAIAYYILGACLYLHPEACTLFDISADKEKKALLDPLNLHLITDSDSQEVKNAYRKRNSLEGIACLERCVFLDITMADAHLVLHEYYRQEKKDELAREHLKAAFDSGLAKAVIEMARQHVKDSSQWSDIKNDVISKLSGVISAPEQYAMADVRECYYLRGKLTGNQEDFEIATKKGHERAKRELALRKRRRQRFPGFSKDPSAPCCFVNSLDGNNFTIISTMPDGKWALYATEQRPGIGANTVPDIYAFLESRQYFSTQPFPHPKTVFLFMSENEERNTSDCLSLLDELFNIALDAEEAQKNALIDCIEIYLGAKYETTAALIDASINDMGDNIYFKVHIVDEARDAAHQLLCDAPLFIPFLDKAQHHDAVHAVLLGCSETNYQIAKESVACAYLGSNRPISITVLGTGAARMEARLRRECPGLFPEPCVSCCIKPRFLECNLEEADFPALICQEQDGELAAALRLGNYFVVDLENDRDSIKLAMNFRILLLRSSKSFDRTPFIAVKCQNNAYLASHLTLDGKPEGEAYYNKYDLFPFGSLHGMYSFKSLIENPLEEVALNVHKAYDSRDIRAVENDYYSFSYNQDSSMATAIGLSYRFFAAGVRFEDRQSYLNYNAFTLVEKYIEAIKGKEEQAAAHEHGRWLGFVLSRGWLGADEAKVRAYQQQATGSAHKHLLAKYHPFIREWSALDPETSEDLNQILNCLLKKFDYDKAPQKTTIESIRKTGDILAKYKR